MSHGKYHGVLWVGIGCQRGTSSNLIEQAILHVFQANGLDENAIAGLATIDRKANEPGLIELVQAKNWAFQGFSSEALSQVTVPSPCDRVNSVVGVASVAEAAAILACQSVSSLIVPKQIYKQPNQVGSVTVAIAFAAR
jgi:cobalamin biosynthesis protein CbiG